MRPLPLLAVLAVALAGCAAPPGPGTGPGAPGTGTGVALAFGAPVDLATVGYEPSIAVDHLGTLYVTAHKALDRPETWPGLASFFAVSRDDGATWEAPARPGGLPLGLNQAYAAAEGDIAVDARGWVYFLDTYLGDNHLHVWSDAARQWQRSGPATGTPGLDDRPWIAGQGEGVLHYLGNNGVPVQGGRHWYYRSDDAGATFSPGQPIPGNGWAHLDAERAGRNVYVVQEWDPAAANGPGPIRGVVSRDGGLTFEAPVTILERAGHGREYPVVSAADDGLAWVVANDCGTEANCADDGAQEPNQLFLARTADAGATWDTTPLTLPAGVFADYPWVCAGPGGVVAVVFYGATTPVTADSEWFVYAAMARPGRTAAPGLDFTRATPQAVYTGADLHALHDFFECAIGPDGTLHVAYMTAEDSTDPVHDYGHRGVWYVQGRPAA